MGWLVDIYRGYYSNRCYSYSYNNASLGSWFSLWSSERHPAFFGVLLGSWVGYWLARLVGQRITLQLLGRHSFMVQKYLSNAGFWTMCTVKLMPGLPYWPVNYGAGALGVKQGTFISATFLASAPGQVSLVALGVFAVKPSVFHGIVLIIAWSVVLVLTWIFYRYWRTAFFDTQNIEKIK